jgi:hypothetical protein
VRCETAAGWIFINLDSNAASLTEFLGCLPDEVKSTDMASLRLVEHRICNLRNNWKVSQEAFLESYHLDAIHPKTAAAVNDSKTSSIWLLDRGHSYEVVQRRELLGEKMIGDAAKRDIAHIDAKFRKLGITYSLFPNFVCPIDPVGFPVLLLWPIDQFTSQIEIYLLGPHRGERQRPAFYDGYFACFDQLMAEDLENIPLMRESPMSGTHLSSLPHYRERRIYWLHQALDDRHHLCAVGFFRAPGRVGYCR